MDEIFGPYEFDGTAWRELHESLTTGLALLPTCSWKPRIAFPTGSFEALQRARHDALDALGPGLQEAAEATFHRNRHNEWPKLSDPGAFVLILAMDHIVEFLRQCYVVTPAGRTLSLFPYSGQTDGALILWLFHRWWMLVGLPQWCEKVVTDRRLFDLYFDEP